MVAFIVERVKDLMNKIFYIPIILLILTGCDKNPDKVVLDVEYLYRESFWFDMKILWMTFLIVMRRVGVSH